MTAANRVNAHGTMGLGRWSIYINNGFWKPRDFDVLIIELLQYAIQGRVSGILLGVPSRLGMSTGGTTTTASTRSTGTGSLWTP